MLDLLLRQHKTEPRQFNTCIWSECDISPHSRRVLVHKTEHDSVERRVVDGDVHHYFFLKYKMSFFHHPNWDKKDKFRRRKMETVTTRPAKTGNETRSLHLEPGEHSVAPPRESREDVLVEAVSDEAPAGGASVLHLVLVLVQGREVVIQQRPETKDDARQLSHLQKVSFIVRFERFCVAALTGRTCGP